MATKPPGRRFCPPTLDDVAAYLAQKGYDDVDAEAFWHFYESKGWRVGAHKMKSWKSAIVTWRKRNQRAAAPAQVKPTQADIQAEFDRVFAHDDG